MRGFSPDALFEHKWTGAQFSLVRAVFGVYLTIHFAHLLPWAAELFSNAGAVPDAAASPFAYVFPNILSFVDGPIFVTAFVGVAVLASAFLAVGYRTRLMAILIWYIGACLFGRNPLVTNPALAFVGWLMLLLAFMPKTAPYGSWSARGRVDPGGGWEYPRSFFTVAWLVMGAGYTYSGFTKLISPSWQDGTAIRRVLESPLARVGPIRDLVLSLPEGILTFLTYSTLWLEILALPLVLIGRLRPWVWLALVGLHIGILSTVAFADLTIGMLMIHFFTFNPAWVRPKRAKEQETIFYDGSCALCQGWVRFVLAEDPGPDHHFRFAPLQSDAFEERLADLDMDRSEIPDSIIVATADGELLQKSEAVFYILQSLGGLWRLLARSGTAIPRPVRDFCYDQVAKVRYRLFGQTEELCPIMPPEMRERFQL